MMQQPSVSIIMNCYNSDRFLEEAIDSVYAQTIDDWEIIFWDNASTDQSGIIARSYDNRLKYFRANETTPLGEARNLALKKVSGKYLAFLDCDDLYLPNKLERQVNLMEHGDFAMCYSSAIIINERGRGIRKIKTRNQSGFLFGRLLKHYEIIMPSVMIRYDILSLEGLNFETSLRYCPDHNLFMEIASRYPVGVSREFIVKYRILDDSLSKQTTDIASSEIRFTLDKIAKQSPKLKTKFSEEFNNAYDKLRYYDAIANIYNNNRMQAREYLRPIIKNKFTYLIIYFLLCVPFPNRFLLKILGR
jgi:glycosyltransferase involved in cell wall biosynthesis